MLRFHQFTVDLAHGCLRTSDDNEIPLRPKSFEVLRYLAASGGRLVSKEEMLKAIWPRVVVGDESLAQCVSEVRHALRDAGQEIIRTVPRRGYRFMAQVERLEHEQAVTALALAGPAPRAPDAPDGRHPVVAVLPFVNLSGDPQQDYFSDGVTEDIITELSRFAELTVIARSSAFQYKGCAVDVRRVGRELGAQYVLAGSLRREGERVRLVAQMAETKNGRQLWADRYERRITDVFSMQDDLANAVASFLAVQIRNAEGQRVLSRPPIAMDAYELYLRAAEAFRARSRSQSAVQDAQLFIEQSLARDAQFARAYVLQSTICWWQYVEPIDTRYLDVSTLERAHELAHIAVQLEPGSPNAHAQLGWTFVFKRQHERGLAEFERAFALNHNFVDSRYALALSFAGRSHEALEILRAQLPIDPFHPFDSFAFVGHAQYLLGNYRVAAQMLSVYPSRAPAVRILPLWLAASYAQLQDRDSARREAAEVLRREPGFTIQRWMASAVYKQTQDAEHMFDGLRKAGLPDR